jgi:hypothetical protein
MVSRKVQGARVGASDLLQCEICDRVYWGGAEDENGMSHDVTYGFPPRFVTRHVTRSRVAIVDVCPLCRQSPIALSEFNSHDEGLISAYHLASTHYVDISFVGGGGFRAFVNEDFRQVNFFLNLDLLK